MDNIRLNRALSVLGICSRRKADVLIRDGLIMVNNKLITTLGTRISESDIIFFNKKSYCLKNDKPKQKIWLYYKRAGLITSHCDLQNRKTVFDDIRDRLPYRVVSVGRLDLNSEGLLLLTNDNAFVKFAESPKTGWERIYKVRVFGKLSDENIDAIEKGITIDGIQYKSVKVSQFKDGNRNTWYTCTLHEGKNREIRRIFEHFGILVNRLIRIQYGPYSLLTMKPGELKRVQ
jgi:23S rRNA pseudouridine2605 synthase